MEIQTLEDHILIKYYDNGEVYDRTLTSTYIVENYPFDMEAFTVIVKHCIDKNSIQIINTSTCENDIVFEGKVAYFMFNDSIQIKFAIVMSKNIEETNAVRRVLYNELTLVEEQLKTMLKID
jgi:hypothetical protein